MKNNINLSHNFQALSHDELLETNGGGFWERYAVIVGAISGTIAIIAEAPNAIVSFVHGFGESFSRGFNDKR